MISKEARESEVDRFIQSRKGSAQLKQERKAKAAAIIKESASSQVAGYTQGRKGRRPIRVDKLLSKLEAQSKTGGFPKQAASKLRSVVKVMTAPKGSFEGTGYRMLLGDDVIGEVALHAGKGTPRVARTWIDPKYQGMGLGKKMYGEVMRRQPQGVLRSDKIESPASQRVWRSIIRRRGGKVGPGYKMTETPDASGSFLRTDVPEVIARNQQKKPLYAFESKLPEAARVKTGSASGVVPPLVQELAFDVLDKLAKRQKAPKQQDLTLTDVAAPGATIAGGGALVASPTTRGALMGYQRMYHGTESDAAKAIKQQGLLASRGGSGAAQVHDAPILERRKDINRTVANNLRAQGASEALIEQEMKERASRAAPRFTEQSTGRVHATRTKPVASFFANYTAKGKGTKPSILKMDLPMDVHRAFEADPDLVAGDAPEALKRQLGERTKQDISSKYIHGGKGYSRFGLGRELLRKFPGYVKAHPGRFAGGAAATGAGLTAMGYGGKRLIDKLQERGVIPS